MNADEIRQALERIDVPVAAAVSRYEVRTGRDSTGDPAAWVFVVVHDEQIENLWPAWDQLRQDIRDAVAAVAGAEVMVYIRMWSVSEVDDQRRASA